jgi:hypothetical protein
MKKYCIGLFFLILSFTGVSQSTGDQKDSRLFQRLVIDIGAAPVTFSDPTQYDCFFYNFAIGYQFGKHFDLRIHRDLIHVFDRDYLGYPSPCVRLFTLSLGGNYRWYSQKTQGIFKGVSYSVALKAGATITQIWKEQQSIFYDISARIYPVKNGYIATGFNHDLFSDWIRWGYPNRQHIETFYFSFGLDF